jgi:peptidoglycan lytic transglycosylase
MTPRMRGWAWRGAACALVVASGCTLFRARQPPPIVNGVQVGIASWYGPGFQGNRTANGEIYDQFELTAAHPSLPLGTRAMVTNLANGRAVEVRINDRGPFVDGRAIDLSYAAARTIGLVGPGTGRVRIEMLRNAPAPPLRTAPVPPPAQEVPTSSYTIEVAALADPLKADHLRSVLASRFPDAFVVPVAGTTGRYYRVRIGPYPLRGVAVARAELVNRLGYPAILLENPEP